MISVLLGNGDGTFGVATSFEVGVRAQSIDLDDIDGDGFVDIVTDNSTYNTSSVFLGHGDGTFALSANFGVGDNPGSVRAGDVTGDGLPDVVVSNYFSNTISVLVSGGYPTSVATRHPSSESSLIAYPNPFRSSTVIAFYVADAGMVSLNLYDVGGRLITRLIDSVRPQGGHEVRWNGMSDNGILVPKGIYFLRLRTPDTMTGARILILQ